jgi:hypothetical protein
MAMQPDCHRCPHGEQTPPAIWPENGLPFQVFLDCRGQFRASFGGAFAMDGNLVMRMIDEHGIKKPHRLPLYRKVALMGEWYLEALRSQKQ